ncbi:glycoside hydrolase family 19 protein [Pluralibacter gergoviae]|uniref:glycoside hydrolase family 19 protein n=1 Tax=Pluralibacter gergoviae TaxID=61647 RepID=UPI0018F63B44|nr:glycoside hydrolase family 19 protein [Pluralibacter gergoviae]
MWHGGIHITDATIPWCALSSDGAEERAYCREPYQGEQFIRCMADGEIVAWRISKDYESNAIAWRDGTLHQSASFVLVRHYVQPGETAASGLVFYTLYMNLAPFSVYGSGNSPAERKVAGNQRYYLSGEDARSGKWAGTLKKDTAVTLSDNVITRASDNRQFTEVIIKSSAGEALPAGTRVWTVSDRGALAASQAVRTPPWWDKCSPAYAARPEGVVHCAARADWSVYLSAEDVLARKGAGILTAGFPLTYEPAAQKTVRPGKDASDEARTFSLATLGRDCGRLKKGDRVWVVSDGDSLTPVAQAGGAPVFDAVVNAGPAVPVSAGDGLGHMGFYQVPLENGKASRYQVHIECLSAGDVERFLSNPEHAGEQSPAFIRYPKGAALYLKNSNGEWKDSGRQTRAAGVLTRAKVPVENGSDGKPARYQVRPEGGWLQAGSVEPVSQYALDKRGFLALDRAAGSFDLIDGIHPPDNVVKGILEQLYAAAKAETRTQYMLNQYNYQRLLEVIDQNRDGHYAYEEYVRAVHVTSYRDHLYRIVAKHDSEWYTGKDDPLWQAYLETLKNVPHWKMYTEAFIEKMKWMKEVPGLAPKVWHMHPVVFLDALSSLSVNFITLEMVLAANLNKNRTQCETVLPYINKYAKAYKMENKKEIAHFLSQIGHESNFIISEEGLNYGAKRMRQIFGCKKGPAQYNKNIDDCNLGRLREKLWTEEARYSHNPENLANYVYANRMGNGNESSGDGYKYRGRGMMQLTGKDGYKFFTKKHNEMSPEDEQNFVSNPDLVINEIEYGVESAFSFWLSKGLDKTAKDSNVSVVTQVVNGGQNGYVDRLERFNAVAPLVGLDKE